MADKEPRRRKKRKDLQASRKEDLQSDDQIFSSTTMEVKDSDQEVEEEVSLPSHQPSVFAKFVFVLLFSALIVSMSFVFISLQGTHRNEIDVFEDHHAEESGILHDIHEAGHDDAETEHDEDEHEEPDHDDTPTWSLTKASFQENIEALLPGIGSILSFKDEPSKESEDVEEQESSIGENVEEKESADKEAPELIDIKSDSETTILQNDIEEDVDDIEDDEDLDEEDDPISPQIPTRKPPDVLITHDAVNIETSSQAPERGDIPSDISPMPELDENDDDAILTTASNVIDDSDYSTYSPNTVPKDEEDDALISNLERMSDEQSQEESNFIENVVEDKDAEALPFYEKGDITNEADYEIRRQLDELEDALEKGFVDDDINDDIDDDEEEDDDYEGDDGIVDEFDFWQF